MNEIKIINGVQAYVDENGVAQLNLDHVAKGLGIVKRDSSRGSTYERINKQALQKWLCSFGILNSEKENLPEFIAENIFYKLCFKANNKVAHKFQDVVTDEILPAIRKTGKYETQQAIEQPTGGELSFEDRLKLIEVIANTPQHAIEYVAGIAKPFMTEDKPEQSTTKPLELKEPKPSKKKNASSAGHTVPFNAKRLRNHLVRNNISQSELVRMSGVASGVISAAISERQRPGLENRGKICVALGKPVDWLNGNPK